MGSRSDIRLVAALGIAALFGWATLRTHTLTLPNFGDVGKALTAVSLVGVSYNRWLWRWLPLRGRPPVLRGTWEMLLTPSVAPEGVSRAAHRCYLSIRQTASWTVASLLFSDGKSIVTTAVHTRDRHATRFLIFYDFVPRVKSAENPACKGAASLDLVDRKLAGSYWNDVQVVGDLASQGRTRRIYATFDAATHGTYAHVLTPRERLAALARRLRSPRRR